jgi:hypothetical protein
MLAKPRIRRKALYAIPRADHPASAELVGREKLRFGSRLECVIADDSCR